MSDNDLHARLYEAIDTNPLDVIGIVETALAELAAELAQARAGEDDTPVDEGTEITPGQWIYRWNRLTAEQRLTKIEGLFHMLDVGYRCLTEGHDDRREELDAAGLRIRELMFGSLAERLSGQLVSVGLLAEQWAALSGPDLDVDESVSDPSRLVAWQVSECGRAVLALLDLPKLGGGELHERIAEAIRRWHNARATVCEHTQIVSFGEAAVAVVAVVQPEIARLRADCDELIEAKRNLLFSSTEKLSQAEAEAHRQRQRAEQAEERLDGQAWEDLEARAKLAEGERDDLRNDVAIAHKVRDEYKNRLEVAERQRPADYYEQLEKIRGDIADERIAHAARELDLAVANATIAQARAVMPFFEGQVIGMRDVYPALASALGVTFKHLSAALDQPGDQEAS